MDKHDVKGGFWNLALSLMAVVGGVVLVYVHVLVQRLAHKVTLAERC